MNFNTLLIAIVSLIFLNLFEMQFEVNVKAQQERILLLKKIEDIK